MIHSREMPGGNGVTNVKRLLFDMAVWKDRAG